MTIKLISTQQLHTRFKPTLATVGVAIFLTACGGSDDDTVSPPPVVVPPAKTTLQNIQELLASDQAAYSAAVPVTGAAVTALMDGCYLKDGRSKSAVVDLVNADPSAFSKFEAYQIGFTYSNVAVTAERTVTNPDGSSRTEADFSYDIAYKDGSRLTGSTTAVTGSTSGLCASPGTGASWRFLGNQRKAQLELRARNAVTYTMKLADGSDVGTSLRRDIQFRVSDPGKVATYAVVTGPAPVGSDGAAFSWKMISPRILRDDTAFEGQVGRANWLDTDSFQACQAVGTAITAADKADCLKLGSVTNNWGHSLPVSDATTKAELDAADAAFDAQGWQAGATYTVSIYGDDGWKTVNGQAGKTPIATYTQTLIALPYKFGELGGVGGNGVVEAFATGKFPDISDVSIDRAAAAAAMRGAGATANLIFDPAVTPAGQAPLALESVSTFVQGTNVGANGSWPRTRLYESFYAAPGSNNLDISILGQPAGTKATSYGEIAVTYTDRSQRRVSVIAAAQ